MLADEGCFPSGRTCPGRLHGLAKKVVRDAAQLIGMNLVVLEPGSMRWHPEQRLWRLLSSRDAHCLRRCSICNSHSKSVQTCPDWELYHADTQARQTICHDLGITSVCITTFKIRESIHDFWVIEKNIPSIVQYQLLRQNACACGSREGDALEQPPPDM